MFDNYPAVNYDEASPMEEDKILFACVRKDFDIEDEDRLYSALSGRPDWNVVLEKSRFYRVSPFLYRHLRGLSMVPAEVKETLRRQARAVFAGNAALLKESEKVINRLHQAGVAAVVLKGLQLSDNVYQDWGLRYFTDVDILIERGDLQKVLRMMELCGFKVMYPERLRFSIKHRFQMMFVKDDIYHIDLHWDLIDLARYNAVTKIDTVGIWNRKKPLNVYGARAFSLSVNDNIIYLCLHLAVQHAFKGLIWYTDINELIRKHEQMIDWRRICADAGSYGVKKSVYYVLHFTRRFFGTAIPEHVFNQINPNISGTEKRLIFAGLKKTNFCDKSEYLLIPAMLDNWGQRMRFVVIESFRSPQYLLYSTKQVLRACLVAGKFILLRLGLWKQEE